VRASGAPATSVGSGADGLAERLLAGDIRALARGITLLENQDPAAARLVQAAYRQAGRSLNVGFTGPPGAGKSTLIGALVTAERAEHRRVAVLSVDPSSPFSSGAVLGDRVRLDQHFLDPGVFIRSMASRGALGGLADAALNAIVMMDAAGHDVVLVETIGVGQTEIDIVNHVDTTALVLMPGAGDSIQAFKSGVMEIPDVFVVNKADSSAASALVRDLRFAISLRPAGDWQIPIVKTEAINGEGIGELREALTAHREYLVSSGELEQRRRRGLERELTALAERRVRAALHRRVREQDGAAVLDELAAGEIDASLALERLLAESAP
jgi:LAO/AO transport system kinase